MATLKYKGASPYTLKPSVPEEDNVYQTYMKDIELKNDGDQSVIGFTLFGVGRAGTIHLNNIVRNPRVNLLYIVEDDQSKWGSIQQHWHLDSVKFLTSKEADRVYTDKNVQAVVVTSPTYTHENIVMNSLEHGKGVFCEKPIAEDIETSKRCFEKAAEMEQTLLAAFNRRFDPAYSSVRDRVRRGEIGHVNIIKVCSRDSPLPSMDYLKISGGIFHDCAVHDIDMILWILGEYPIRVAVSASANIPEIKEIGDFDTVAIVLTFASGTVGIIDLSRFSNYGYDQRLEVFGFKGMVKARNQESKQGLESSGVKREVCPIFYSFASRYQSAYASELEHFLNVFQGKEKLMVDPRDTLAVSKVASACEESARTGKAVEIEWSPEEVPIH